MKETYIAGAYWPARKESLEACARRAAKLFQALGHCDPCLTRWFEKAYSLKKALQLQFEPDFDTLLRLFNKRGYKKAAPIGGVSFGAWTGDKVDGRGAMVYMRCGLDDQLSGNACVLDLPYEEPDASRVLTAACATAVLRAMVEAWEPEQGFICSHELKVQQGALGEVGSVLGWVTYFPQRSGPLPALPAPARVEPVEGLGHLLVLTPERLTASNPEHLALIDRVRQVLEPAGLLKPRKG